MTMSMSDELVENTLVSVNTNEEDDRRTAIWNKQEEVASGFGAELLTELPCAHVKTCLCGSEAHVCLHLCVACDI